MVEVNGAYKHHSCEKRWLNSLCVMSNIKDFAAEDGQSASQTQLIT